MLRVSMATFNDSLSHNRLRYNVLLETLSDDEFRRLEPQLTERRYRSGETIIEDEGYGGEVFFLAEGRVRITKQPHPGEEQLLALLHPGDCFGELEPIASRPRSARVAAIEECVTYTLGKADFEHLLYRCPALAIRLLQVLSIRLRALNNHYIADTGRRNTQHRHELRTLERLIEAAKSLNSTLDLNELLDILLDIALGIVDGDRGTVYILDEVKQELWTRVAKGLDGANRVTIRVPLGKGIAGYVAATGDTINTPDAYLDPRFNPDFDRQTGYRTRSILCMPIHTNTGKIIGVVQLLNKRTGEFSDDDARIMHALSLHAAIALENARLVEQERRKIRIERDLLAAREVQLSLLPAHVPAVPGYEFAATALPARDIAGDLYDFIRLDPHRLAISMGDVSGKGLPAALLMAHIQASVRDVAHETASAGACTTLLNQRLVASTAPEKFVTLVYGILDTQEHTFQYSNGGHNPPLLASPGKPLRLLDTGGTLMGIIEGAAFEEETVTLEPGDVIVQYTDGIPEATNGRQELLGEERLAHLIDAHKQYSAGEIMDAILSAVMTHQGSEPAADDMTIVVIRRLPV
ncbi:MAG TPA: SpoIIE family protein phosphatase [Bacteroidota bacterium]|nr:SpoIIE family protein phosphatase [Bacteroidota bacterium]